MNPDRQHAIDYLRAPARGLWRWAENGAVLVWHNGDTIAFREEITQVLEWLGPNGLPSFGAIAFLLAAGKGKLPSVAEIVGQPEVLLPQDADKAAVLVTARRQLAAQLEAALVELRKVSRLPTELISGVKAKCILAEAVFEPAKVERYADARTVLRGWPNPVRDEELLDADRPGVSGAYIRQIHIVAQGLKRHTAESLELRVRTGLDALPKEIQTDLPTAERARRLIEELSRDRELGTVARAARELLAAVRLPRRLGEREQLAVGGVADITNRGPLDRLLLSELAHDDLTLAVRVALNEALYLRREPPMREPPGTLALLLDSGVRLWGVPRVLATAVALALVARDKQHVSVSVWRASGRELERVDLLSRHGLVQHLGALETTAHPGESVPAFAAAVATGAEHQSVLVTHRDSLDDPEFRRALADHPSAPGFVATVDRDGRFELHALPLARRPALCEADLDLASVFEPRSGVPPIRREIEPGLPAIFGVSPFPFLLPVSGLAEFWTRADDGFAYAVLNDRRLVQFRDHRFGARVLATELPFGKILWMEMLDGVVHLVKQGGSQRPARLLSVPLPEGPVQSADLAAGSLLCAVQRCGDVILVIRFTDVRVHALSDGRLLGRAVSPHQWMHGRFFRGRSHIYFATWDGEQLKFEPVSLPKPFEASAVRLMFDRDGLPGPWFVSDNGHVFSSETGEQVSVKYPGGTIDFLTVRVSRDGHRLQFMLKLKRGQPRRSEIVVSLKDGTSREVSPAAYSFFEPQPILPNRNLFSAMVSVARMPEGPALCGRKGRRRRFHLDLRNKIVMSEFAAVQGAESMDLPFPEKSRIPGHGCSLQIVEWPDGVKAFLDSRGLLHLKSKDPRLPEVSLVLSDNEVAGWTSDGHVCGPEFFFEGPQRSEPELVMQAVSKILGPP